LPIGGITADVIAVTSFDDLAKLGKAKIEGKIVLYNQEWNGYGFTRPYRATGAARSCSSPP
jgi:carboxypeptidase Q